MELIVKIALLFALLFVGFFARKLNIVNETFHSQLARFVVYITMPVYILVNMSRSFDNEVLSNSFKLLLISLCIYIILCIISYISRGFWKVDNDKKPMYQLGMVFANTGFLGFPVISVVLSPSAVFYAAIFNVFFDLFLWTYGIFLIKKDKVNFNIKMIISPNLVAIILGFTFFLTSFSFPDEIFGFLKTLGGLTPTLAMIVIGLMLSEVKMEDFKDVKYPLILSLYKLLIIPIMIYIVLYALGFRGYLLIIPTIIMGMPVAANTAIISGANGARYDIMTVLIIISTLLSMISIPVIAEVFV
ncbi:MAG: hypothetical protein CSB16_00980 [Clostridiales bacterium]|nr:MAG: hypothetical protein CSB16_00980 [Clostridiales bacterium]